MHSCGACRETYGLAIDGLMCIPPADEAPAPHFALTAKIAQRNGLAFLSMGMSADFAAAIDSAPPMCGSAAPFSATGHRRPIPKRVAAIVEIRSQRMTSRVRGPSRQQLAQPGGRQRHAAGRRRKLRPRHVDENRAAAAGDRGGRVLWSISMIEVVELVVAPQPVAWCIGRVSSERPVVAAVGRILAPAVVGPDAAHRQQRARARTAVGPPPQPQQPEAPARRRRRRPRACWPGCRRARAPPAERSDPPAATRASDTRARRWTQMASSGCSTHEAVRKPCRWRDAPVGAKYQLALALLRPNALLRPALSSEGPSGRIRWPMPARS